MVVAVDQPYRDSQGYDYRLALACDLANYDIGFCCRITQNSRRAERLPRNNTGGFLSEMEQLLVMLTSMLLVATPAVAAFRDLYQSTNGGGRGDIVRAEEGEEAEEREENETHTVILSIPSRLSITQRPRRRYKYLIAPMRHK